jgi:thioredoxin-related protein
MLDKETYPNAKVVGLASKFIPVKIDAGTDTGGKVFEKFKGEGVPLIVFLNPKGKEVNRFTGFLPPDDFVKEMQTSLKKAK